MSHAKPADFKADKISTNVHRHASRGVLFLGPVVVAAAAHYKKFNLPIHRLFDIVFPFLFQSLVPHIHNTISTSVGKGALLIIQRIAILEG
jgi:hypothetical protein